MGIVYKSSLKEHILVETAYDDDRQVGGAQAITDGYDWSLMFGLNVADGYSEEQIGSELVRRLLDRLSGQHVFVSQMRSTFLFTRSWVFCARRPPSPTLL